MATVPVRRRGLPDKHLAEFAEVGVKNVDDLARLVDDVMQNGMVRQLSQAELRGTKMARWSSETQISGMATPCFDQRTVSTNSLTLTRPIG
jgi:hypothetical protein